METIIKVQRRWFTDKSTIGELFFDNSTARHCYTLEDRVRHLKVYGVTAIPEGRYEMVISYSNRFGKLLPLLVGVPGYEGIRIHPGNTDANTDGCLLVGMDKGTDVIMESRKAFGIVFAQIQDAMNNGKVFIKITNEPISDLRSLETV